MYNGSPLAENTAIVVGGGVGGLSAACYLAKAGADVTVLEKNESLGGVVGRLEVDGFSFDTGPSWYMMPETFERFFEHFNRSAGDYYQLERLDPQYRVFFKDNDRIDVTPDLDQIRRVFESYEEDAAATLDDYLETAEHTYQIGMTHFVYEDRSRFRDLLDWHAMKGLSALLYLKPMQEHVEDYFNHPKLQQLLQYTLVFLGGAPQKTPALYNLMTHVDFNLGVYYPIEGMFSLIEAIAELGEELGVSFRTRREVTGLEPNAGGIRVHTVEGRDVVDYVVANANPEHVECDLLPPEHRRHGSEYWEEKTYGPSAFLLFLGIEGGLDELAHHNLVLPTDWDPHFERIFDDPEWPEDPAYYVSVPSKTDDNVAPNRHHSVVVLVPIAPGLRDDPETRDAFRDQILSDLADSTGVDFRERIRIERSVCVTDFTERYNTPGGTALGLAHTRDQTGPLRPSHRYSTVDGLYYTGAFTCPGVGLPMAIVSGEHAAEAVAEDAARWTISDLLPTVL